MRYKIVRMFRDQVWCSLIIKTGLSLEEARAYCSDPETSSSTCKSAEGKLLTKKKGPWFDGYEEE